MALDLHTETAMNYNPRTGHIQITTKEAERACCLLRQALKNIRRASGRTLDKHERPGVMDYHDHAGLNILDAAKALGIDMGAEWPEQLDLRGDS